MGIVLRRAFGVCPRVIANQAADGQVVPLKRTKLHGLIVIRFVRGVVPSDMLAEQDLGVEAYERPVGSVKPQLVVTIAVRFLETSAQSQGDTAGPGFLSDQLKSIADLGRIEFVIVTGQRALWSQEDIRFRLACKIDSPEDPRDVVSDIASDRKLSPRNS